MFFMDFLFRAYQEEDECGWYRDLRIDAMDEYGRQLLGLVRFWLALGHGGSQ